MMATSGIENVIRLWEPGNGDLESDSRVILDLVRVCKENQHRMGVDPFEVMLMRMGFRLAMAEEAAASEGQIQLHLDGSGGEGVAGEGQGGGGVAGGQEEPMQHEELRWIENPTNCRQS